MAKSTVGPRDRGINRLVHSAVVHCVISHVLLNISGTETHY